MQKLTTFANNSDPKQAERCSLIVMLVCAIMPLVIAATFCGLYWVMWSEAFELIDWYRKMDVLNKGWPSEYESFNPYDSCPGLGTVKSETNTNWLIVHILNSISYLI